MGRLRFTIPGVICSKMGDSVSTKKSTKKHGKKMKCAVQKYYFSGNSY